MKKKLKSNSPLDAATCSGFFIVNDFDRPDEERIRMRRLSRHTETTYAGWIARFGAHVKSPLDALPMAANVVPFVRSAAA